MIAKPAAIPPICGANTDSTPAPSVTISSGHSRFSDRPRGRELGQRVLVLGAGQQVRDRVRRLACASPCAMPISVASTHQPKQT